MKRKLGVLIAIAVMLTTLTGCWNRIELNELGIVMAMGIEKKGDQYKIYFQIVNPGEVASKRASGLAPATLYEATGDTIFQAARKVTMDSPRKAYFSHLRVLIIDEETAKEGLGKPLDFISRDHEMRSNFYILISKDKELKTILGHFTGLERIPANKMFNALEASERAWAATGKITLDRLITEIILKGKQPVLSGIEIHGNGEEGKTKENDQRIDRLSHLRFTGFAVLLFDKFRGWLNEDESIGFNFTQGDVKSAVLDIACPKGGKLAVEVIRTQAKINGLVEDGQPQGEVKLRVEANIGDVECDLDVSQTKSIQTVEKKVEQVINDKIEMAIKKTKKYKSDVIGFGRAIHRADPKTWKQLEENWDEQSYPELPVKIKTHVDIRRLGTVTKSINQELKE